MRRRKLLAAGATLLAAPFAGCVDPAGVLQMSAESDAGIAEQASRDADGLPPELRDVVVAAIEDGSGTVSATSPPVDEGLPLAHDGAFYDLSWEVVGERTITRYTVEIDYDPEDASGPSVAVADLPDVDREVIDRLVPPRDDRRVEGYDMGVSSPYSEEEAETSVLVPEQEYDVVVHEGNRYRIRTGDGREVTENTYEYTAAEVAASPETYAADLRERYLFTLSGLSDAEREVVDVAIDEGYYADSTDDDAFRSVAERLRSHDAVSSDEYEGDYLVRYEGTVYWTHLYLGQFAEN